MLHIISLRAQISQNVKYWYGICNVLVPIFTRCEELVPIFHSVKFVKCEICGSTKLMSLISKLRIQACICPFLVRLCLPNFTINVTIFILILSGDL